MDYKAARQAMVDCQLATNNVISKQVLDAMSSVPREIYLPESKKDAAYLDEDTLIGEGRYLLEPMIFARLLQAAEPKPNDIALDIGCATGYSSSVLSKMVETVISVESNEVLLQHAVKIWEKMNYCNIVDLQGKPGTAAAKNAPYDIIFVNGAVNEIPSELVMQLKPDTGRMVCVLRKSKLSNGHAVLVKRTDSDEISVLSLFDANVPYLTEFAPKECFKF